MFNNNDERAIIEFDDTTRAWNDWKYGNVIQNSIVHEKFSISLVECTKLYMAHSDVCEHMDRATSFGTVDIPSLVTEAPEISIHCHVCRKYQGQLYPCRTCGKVYHQKCIKDIGEIKSFHSMENATHKILGWSCPICEDLRVLLSPQELVETNEWIQSLDSQSTINLDTYIKIRTKSKLSEVFYSDELHNHIKTILEIFLHTITDITSNRLSQLDLLILDICMKIFHTPVKSLVHALTTFELYRLSQLFISLSSADNRCASYNKTNEFFNTYLLAIIPEINSNEKKLHLEALLYSFLGIPTKFDQTWTQFLLNATIPTLLGRYNHRRPPDFINRIISIKGSTSPTIENLIEQNANQSLAILMNHIFQKLKQIIGDTTKDYLGFGRKEKRRN
ncbi:unnamed protein product [Rotaria socialis]|uniref:PHD-type domain-containing protein n=2 Tax=Rotaria socialis TaxID=392032 RepID=A0A821B2F8_9BILA|nr:unnamed protein product [Rotaria socialis]